MFICVFLLRRDGDSDAACFAFPRIPTVCRRHPVQIFCSNPRLLASLPPRLATLHGDSDAACFAFPRIPTVCRRHPVQIFCSNPRLLASLPPRLAAKSLRRDGDSNPGNTFGVYTLSRRASSTTRASLLRDFSLIGYKSTAFFANTQEFALFFAFFFVILCQKGVLHY